MTVRVWTLVAALVAGIGCTGGSHSGDKVDATDGGSDSGLGAASDSGPGAVVDASRPTRKRYAGVDASAGLVVPGETDGSVGDAGVDCVWDFGNPNKCTACAADATCDAPEYTVNGDGTVASSCCGLEWQQFVDENDSPGRDGLFSWEEAKAYCASLSLAAGGWRLPAIEELFSLVVLGQSPKMPTIDRAAFPHAPLEGYWSSSAQVDRSDVAWLVGFTSGTLGSGAASSSFRVRCVR